MMCSLVSGSSTQHDSPTSHLYQYLEQGTLSPCDSALSQSADDGHLGHVQCGLSQ